MITSRTAFIVEAHSWFQKPAVTALDLYTWFTVTVDIITGALSVDWVIVLVCIVTSSIVLLILVLLWRRFVL